MWLNEGKVAYFRDLSTSEKEFDLSAELLQKCKRYWMISVPVSQKRKQKKDK